MGAVKVKGYKVLKEYTFQTLIIPHRQISREIMELNGISEEDTKASPSVCKAIQSFAITLPCCRPDRRLSMLIDRPVPGGRSLFRAPGLFSTSEHKRKNLALQMLTVKDT
ncbi:hypothetical protein FZC78_08515 [Rossellomorea vietnamensis]|uniref:Exonuclease domain-containing protein n=1 Tax=Rossellomorea vietnamensis TaxID=218284 RepID=A0A5D4NW05_9BACI|nr:hypothetical protein FZC78_08515 [Rossellomorea vietnamensis]